MKRRWCVRELGLAALLLAVLTGPASACVAGFTGILMSAIPPAVRDSPVIARVKILDVQPKGSSELRPWSVAVARARVLAPVKGATFGQTIRILATETTCGGRMDRSGIDVEGFIAGNIGSDGLFRGTWHTSQLGPGWSGYLESPPPFPPDRLLGFLDRLLREAWRGEPGRK
jgi:hypothetical protein